MQTFAPGNAAVSEYRPNPIDQQQSCLPNEGASTVNTGRQAVLMWTGLGVAVLAGVLSFLSWDRADQVAGVVSAVVGVAALGVSV